MRVLMLGNSLTAANDLPALLGRMLGAEVVAHTRGGARLAEHLNPATRLGGMTQRAFAAGGWDFVVLQESSNGPVVHRERFLETAARLCAQAKDASIVPVFFETWAYAPNCPKLSEMGMTHDVMHRLLVDAYHEAARTSGALIADVGTAFFEAPDKLELYRPDGVHPSEAGTQLAARIIARALQENRTPD